MHDLKIAIIDDHKLFVKGFILLLKNIRSEYRMEVVIESQSESDLLKQLENVEVELIFVDLNLDHSDGINLIKIIRTKIPTIKVIVVSMIKDSKFIREAFKAGADGYLSKETDVEDVEKAIHKVMEGEIYFGEGVETVKKRQDEVSLKSMESNLNRFNAKFHLTKRELEILSMLVEGKTSKEISAILYISKDTVNVHRKNLMKKLNISNVVMLVKIVKDYNII